MLKLWLNSLPKHVTTLSVYKMSIVCGKDSLNVPFKILVRLDLGLGRISSPRNRTVAMVASTLNILLYSISSSGCLLWFQ
ncbi:hypothetical protein D5086_008956 [Populus alba]|uniref:Uncharacterized protein n=1 Tax=Populus alba TaxID=43335 RepID=A0ACC4CH81_POPAL